MLRYDRNLRESARQLRKGMTDSEIILWSRVRRKQLMGIQFYRQKPIGKYVVDFFAPSVGLVIEVDGSQHMEEDHLQRDQIRDEYLTGLGLRVLRFNSREVLVETDAVMEKIFWMANQQLKSPVPPFIKGGIAE